MQESPNLKHASIILLYLHKLMNIYLFIYLFLWVYMSSPSWTPLPSSSPSHPSQCTSPEHLVSCIEPGLGIHFTYDNIHVSMPFSQIIPPSMNIYLNRRFSPTLKQNLYVKYLNFDIHMYFHWRRNIVLKMLFVKTCYW